MDADITILGAGPVGSALALLLADGAPDPSRIVLCRAPARPPAGQAWAHTADPRAIALNHGSRLLLQRLRAWPAHGAGIHAIHVSQRGRLGRTVIQDTDFGVPALGSVHTYGSVQAVLHQALASAGVTLRDGHAELASAGEDAIEINQNDRRWRSRVAVQAEGGPRAGTPGVLSRSYGQHAVLALVRAAAPRPGWAWERFTGEGPLALLPVRFEDSAEDTYSLVWCCAPERADQLAALDDARFGQALSEAFGDRLGPLAGAGPRHVFPLELRWRREPVAGRIVAIGNAAQTLHPVAGQGLNLGLRDAAALADTLHGWLRAPEGDPRPRLQDYARARRADRAVTAGVTDFLPRVFATRWSLVEHACGLGLLALDALPGVKRPLARQLMQGLRV
ncbi:UbiH/UbiF/VisC/COQ6 family ubiquinone biosynthesis hydroxylase [Verticiella sediminum]|uniref:UbiH/UbiF/VisC/COQ6 family ubiquinone biosynthesis hydroxylase n=1 Tax=Verticiella sediminum TaxID=1247510 RepID=A0A556B204_9BURK|nr:UbiH/UbiF/VisC/COQ6 family ubiquinone biosynthesis hydroxylase [Verticiella sediminum]TSH99226.1 UbiH/UbiF/VisC/COQ6 family ubiquinone biosynthesis hydroxylase [Verticiella sediminum]